jgi:Ca2+-binding EF-hand superfamily protein
MAFDILDKDGNGMVEPQDIITCYNAKKHPDVISRRKTEQQVLREFLDTFDVGGEVDGKGKKSQRGFTVDGVIILKRWGG